MLKKIDFQNPLEYKWFFIQEWWADDVMKHENRLVTFIFLVFYFSRKRKDL